MLASICEILKAEIERATAIDNSMIALARAILQSDSPLKKQYEEHWGKVTFSAQGAVPPLTAESLVRLGELIQRLKE